MAIRRSTKKAKERIVSYDVTRTIAILLVVLCHATELIYTLHFMHPELTGGTTKLVATTVFTLGRLGVPLFLFLTGALVLKKQIEKDEDILSFYKKNLLPLIIVNTVWVIFYNIFFAIMGNWKEVTVEYILKELFFMRGVNIANMWYMPMIIGIYLALPFIAKIVKTFTEKSLRPAIIVIFFSCFILPFINAIVKIGGGENDHLLFSCLDLSFLGGCYGLYVLIGHLLTQKPKTKKKTKTKIKSIWLILIALFSFLFACFMQIISRCNQSYFTFDIWYDSPLLLICSACIFTLINRLDFSKLNKKLLSLITFISRASLAIFFTHIIVQLSLCKPINSLHIFMPIKLFLLYGSSLIISIPLCYLLSKSKFISKYILLIK